MTGWILEFFRSAVVNQALHPTVRARVQGD